MKLTHLGHACVLIEMADTRIALDPGVFTPDLSALTDLDAIVVTHQHLDHLDRDRLPGLLAANPTARLITDPESAQIVRDLGIDVQAQNGSAFTIGAVTVEPVGEIHALIHDEIPRIANVGVTLRAAGEPSFHHPGDSVENTPGDVDIVGFPINAPWQASREMTAFLRRVGAAHAVPIHDGLLNATGRTLYLTQAGQFGHPDTQIHDLEWGSSLEVRA
ncbi:MBL fold metallo-hydrolase [Kribbia dieselivorans]|uniref:MBL fold metallo-hydrolase n=1 Tax=Kribbia dieselivorans TaxID=331526 RepID=UPI000837F857|nr:MBL fold metallo-hydrolase [Kribbia dieselivorans]